MRPGINMSNISSDLLTLYRIPSLWKHVRVYPIIYQSVTMGINKDPMDSFINHLKQFKHSHENKLIIIIGKFRNITGDEDSSWTS